MKREEITICKIYLDDLDKTHDCNEYKLLMELLNREPCEDCVSKAELKKWLDLNFSFGGALRKLEMFDRIDKELPSVTPTRKKGRWIRKPIRNNNGGCVSAEMICTCCGKDNECDKKLKYCPNCGAEMEVE